MLGGALVLVITAVLSLYAQGPGPATLPWGWVLSTSVTLVAIAATLLLVRAVGRG